jgi:hypothetical protein
MSAFGDRADIRPGGGSEKFFKEESTGGGPFCIHFVSTGTKTAVTYTEPAGNLARPTVGRSGTYSPQME